MLLSTMTAGIALLVTVTLSVSYSLLFGDDRLIQLTRICLQAAASISSDVPGLPYPLTVPTITGTYNGHSYELKGTTQVCFFDPSGPPDIFPSPHTYLLTFNRTSSHNLKPCTVPTLTLPRRLFPVRLTTR